MDSFEEELVAVEAIFPECISRDVQSSHRLTIHPFSDSGSNAISITLSIPEDYPGSPPVLIGLVGISQSLVREILAACWAPGEVCLYVLVDKLRELPYGSNTNETQSRTPHMSSHNHPTSARSSSSDDDDDDEGDRDYKFAVSNPIVDRKSTFVGRAIEVYSRAEARSALLWLKNHNKKISRATHNIVAWRVVEDGILMQDNDDDGEDAAGGRLAHLLDIMDIKNVMVIVSRWYGGIMLHGDRFKHISNAGREALQIGGFLPESGGSGGLKKKSKKKR